MSDSKAGSQPWHEFYTLPPYGNMMQPGENARENFIRIGDEISGNMYDTLTEHAGHLGTKKVLEFGCGVGRLVMPLYHRHRVPTHACDVSGWCIGFLKREVKGPDFAKTENDPPLPYDEGTFDALYSVSVFTHLPHGRQMPWLRDLERILKPGGIAAVTTSGYRALRYRREQRRQEFWRDVSDDELERRGIIYADVDIANHDGVTGEYGYTAHSPDYIAREWAAVFDVIEQIPAGAGRMQDINVLRKRPAA